MQDTYFCSLLLGASREAEPPGFDSITKTVCSWLNEPRRRLDRSVELEELAGGIDAEFAPGVRIRSLRIELPHGEALGVRLDHPDGEDDDLFWRSDVVVEQCSEPRANLRVSIRVALGSRDDAIAPIAVTHSRPRLVPALIRTFGAHEVVPLGLVPRTVSPEEAASFVQLLTNEDRTLPVVFISARNWDDKPSADPIAIGDNLAGLAHVVVARSRFTSRKLADLLPQRLNCYDGGVRIYWPGLLVSDDPFRHPLWVPDRIHLADLTPPGFRGQILARIARASLHRFVPGVARWGDLERAHMHQQLTTLKDAGSSNELLRLFEVENERLEQENRDLRLRLPQLEGEVERARNLATAWRQAYEAARKGGDAADRASQEDQPIESVQDALVRIELEFEEELVLTGRLEPDPLFDNPDGLYLALRWLATTYRDAKLGKKSCPELDVSCREASGFWYRAHQSKLTMSKYEDEYSVQWEGRRVPLEEHLGTGSSKSGLSTMRIAFFFDPSTQRVVVGFLGQHQPTDAT